MKNFYNSMPLIVFFLGLLFIPLIERLKKNWKLKMLELYYNELISYLIPQVKKQIQEIEKCLKDIDNFDQNSFTLARISGSSISSLDKLNNEDLFRIFILRRLRRYKDKISDFKNLNEFTNYFKEALPHLFHSNEKAIDLYDKYRLDWNDSQNTIVDVYNNFITTNNANGIKKGNDKFVDNLCLIFDNFFDKYGIDVQNIKLGYEEFVNPLIEFSKNNSVDYRSYYLLSALQTAGHSFKEMMTIREDHREFLTLTSNDMTLINNKLIDLMRKFKNQKLRIL